MNDAIVLRANEPECAVGDKPPPSPLKVTIESGGSAMTLDIIEKDSKLTVLATIERDGESETRELPDRVVRSVKHTVERLLVITHTVLDGGPLCLNCGHEKVLHVPGHECAGDLYAGGKTCNCPEFRTP